MSSNRSLKPAIKKVLEAAGIVPEYAKISKTQIADVLPDEDLDAWDPMVSYYVRNCLLAYETDEGLVEPLYPAAMMQGGSHKKKLKIAKKFRLFPVAASSSDDVVVDLDTGEVWYLVGHSLAGGEPMMADREEFEDLLAYFKSRIKDSAQPVDVKDLATHKQLRMQSPGARFSAAKEAIGDYNLELLRTIMDAGLKEDFGPGGQLEHDDSLGELLLFLNIAGPELAQYLAGELGFQFKIVPYSILVKPENLAFIKELARLGAFVPCQVPMYDQRRNVERIFKEKYNIEVKL